MANRPDEFLVFTKLDEMQLVGLCGRMNFYVKDFEANFGLSGIYPDFSVLLKIYDRIEKRRVYFHVYYNGCRMGELNEASLMCFWILKLMPFSRQGISTNELNAKIALYLLNNAVIYYARKYKRGANIFLSKNLYYAFLYRDLSKEAIMALAESMIIRNYSAR